MTRHFPDGNPELIWNKGIAALCDRRIPDEFPGNSYRPVSTLAGSLTPSILPDNLISDAFPYRDIQDGELVWVRLSWLKSFVKQVLPLLSAKFVLVTGDSDSCVPSEVRAEANAILASPNVLHWYAQNCDGSVVTEKISGIPIGIDFHMLCERPIWGEDMSSARQQEQILLSIRDQLPALGDRIPKVYVDFAWQRGFSFSHYRTYHPLRGTAISEHRWRTARKIRRNELVFCQPGPLPRSELWRSRGKYAFVLSPHGMGLDCHRTWESLALGHIVLVPSSTLDGLYADLPVVTLKSWEEITRENIEKWLSHRKQNRGIYEKLKSRYWIDRMRAKAQIENGPLLSRQRPDCVREGAL